MATSGDLSQWRAHGLAALAPESHFISLIAVTGLTMLHTPLSGGWTDHELTALRSIAEHAHALLHTLRGAFLAHPLGALRWTRLSALLRDASASFASVLATLTDATSRVPSTAPLLEELLRPPPTVAWLGPAVVRAMLAAAACGIEGALAPRTQPAADTAGDTLDADTRLDSDTTLDADISLNSDTTLVASPSSSATPSPASSPPRRQTRRVSQKPAPRKTKRISVDELVEALQRARPRLKRRYNTRQPAATSALAMVPYVARWLADTGREWLLERFEAIARVVDLAAGDPEVEEKQREELVKCFEGYGAIVDVWDVLRRRRIAGWRLRRVVLDPAMTEYEPTDAGTSDSVYVY